MAIGKSGRTDYQDDKSIVVAVAGDFAEAACRLLETVGEELDVLPACSPHRVAVVVRLYLPVDVAVFVLRLVRRPLRVVDELPADEGDGDSSDVDYGFRAGKPMVLAMG